MQIDVTIRPVGNSRGIIIPKQVLDDLHFGDKAVLEVDEATQTLLLKKPDYPRKGWAEALAAHPPEALTEEERDWLEFEDGL